MTAMRVLLAICLAVSCAAALAQSRPPKLEPLPEPPPPPPMSGADEPRVRIPVQEGDKVEEIREGGRVVMPGGYGTLDEIVALVDSAACQQPPV